jgi:cell division protein FtsI/penicillin-binding protein 2
VRSPSRRFFLPLIVAAALSLPAAASAAHPVDLRHPRVTDDGVYAPLTAGGPEVKLTLDPRLQRAAERLLAHSGAHEGAIVASDVRTGRILAWASRGERDYVAEPFAPSASLFKIATAAALLEGGRVTPATRECYEGGEHEIRPADLDRRGATCTTLAEALGHSINLVVARLARKYLTPADLRRQAAELGFSGEVPIDVPVGSSVVRIPDDPFGMARASAGFWNGQLTPLGGLYAVQTIANDGERVRFSILDHGGVTARTSAGRAVSGATARALGRMLELTTRRGTAAKAFRRPDGTPYLGTIPVAAKTGTLIGGARPRMYSWFAAFAPSTKPEIAINVMLGNDLRWHTKANIIGRELLEAYFKVGDARPAQGAVASTSAHGKRKR